MKKVITTPRKIRWRMVVAGHFVEVQDLVSHIELLLKSHLRYAEIATANLLDQVLAKETDEEVQATLQILVQDGTELQAVKKLLKTETYKWIRIVDEGEIQSNDNGENVLNA